MKKGSEEDVRGQVRACRGGMAVVSVKIYLRMFGTHGMPYFADRCEYRGKLGRERAIVLADLCLHIIVSANGRQCRAICRIAVFVAPGFKEDNGSASAMGTNIFDKRSDTRLDENFEGGIGNTRLLALFLQDHVIPCA